MTRTCFVWCCYDDPYDRQCVKIVKKSNNMVRCTRLGTTYVKEKNKYLCDMHYKQYLENQKSDNKRTSIDISEGSSSD